MRSLPKPSRLDEPVSFPKKAADAAEALQLRTAGDLLEYFPRAHADRRDVRPIAALGLGEKGTIAAVVRSIKVRPTRNRRVKIVEAKVADESGPITAIWFNQPWLATKLPEGTRVLLHGEVRKRNQFTVAEYEVADDAAAAVHTVGFVPVYAATKGITPAMLRERAGGVRALVYHAIEPLPGLLRAPGVDHLAGRDQGAGGPFVLAVALAPRHLQLEHQQFLEGQPHTCVLVLLLVLGEVRSRECGGAVGQAAPRAHQRR